MSQDAENESEEKFSRLLGSSKSNADLLKEMAEMHHQMAIIYMELSDKNKQMWSMTQRAKVLEEENNSLRAQLGTKSLGPSFYIPDRVVKADSDENVDILNVSSHSENSDIKQENDSMSGSMEPIFASGSSSHHDHSYGTAMLGIDETSCLEIGPSESKERSVFHDSGLASPSLNENCQFRRNLSVMRSDIMDKAISLNNEHKYLCPWTGCQHIFSRTDKLEMHVRCAHTGDRPFPCPQCSKSFARCDSLKAHIRRVHDREKRHMCTVEGCDKGFFSVNELKSHTKRHETTNWWMAGMKKEGRISAATVDGQ